MYDVEMDTRIKKIKLDDGSWIDATKEDGSPIVVPFAKVVAYHIWDTDERYVEEKATAPIASDDLVDGFK
jgi:hypothetical protein